MPSPRDDADGLSISSWLAKCLGRDDVALRSWRDVGRGSGCRVLDSDVGGDSLLLKLYSPGFDDYSRLGPENTARKHALALAALPRFGVPTPRCMGFAVGEGEAALAMQRLDVLPFTPAHRVEAAKVLARLHAIQIGELGQPLADLVSRSRSNRSRVGEVPGEPPLKEIALQHGDYFSVNLAATPDGVNVLDWDLFAVGDPMWDLGFLVSADRCPNQAEAAAVIAAYQEIRPISTERLAWHRECWKSFWSRRQLSRPEQP